MAGQSYRRSPGLGGTVGFGIFVVPGVAAALLGPAALSVWLLVGLSAGAVAYALASAPGANEDDLPLFLPSD